MKENQLLISLSKGDQHALKHIYETYYEQLVYFCHRFVRDQDKCRELVQDVFVSIWENRAGHAIKSLKPYLYISVRNKALNFVKRERIYAIEDEITVESTDHNTPENQLQFNELKASIDRAIGSLPEKCREIFVLSRMSGSSYAEIAAQLNISVKTVENQMGIALKKLRHDLKHMIEYLTILFCLTFSLL